MQQLLLQTKNIEGPQEKHMSLLRFLSLFTRNPAERLKLPHKGQVRVLQMAQARKDNAVRLDLLLVGFLFCSVSY